MMAMFNPDTDIFSYKQEQYFKGFKPITMETKEEMEIPDDIQDKSGERSSTHSDSTLSAKAVRSIDILQYLTDSLAGKDKLAKIVKYVLDILRLLVVNSRKSITKWDPSVLIHYKKVLNTMNLRMILGHPATITKVLLVAVFENFESKANFISQQLSTYRYILRFGGTPFRLVKLLAKIKQTEMNRTDLQKNWFNEASLGDLIDFYYGICDEMVLLHKLKVWSNSRAITWFSRHESISWQYDILLGLKKNWVNLETTQKKLLDLEIQMKVRERALKLSTNLKGSSGLASPIKRQLLSDLNNGNDDDADILQKIELLKHEKFVSYLDLARLSFDLLANSTDIFNLKTLPGTYAVLSLSSGIVGFVKLWINAKKELAGRY